MSRMPALLVAALLVGLAGAAAANPADPQLGLYLDRPGEPIALPLESTRVRGTVNGFVAEVHVTQSYVNPYAEAIEATYVFPLPHGAAVSDMVMHLADRDVIAEIQPREKAEAIYDEAREAGRTAALMTQERANVFTQKVANIPPGDRVEVKLTYIEALPYTGGVSELVFPTVVGPRYVPGAPLPGADHEPSGRSPDTTRVPDASRITPPALADGEKSAHRIDLELDIAPGLPIARLSSPSHRLRTVFRSKKTRATVGIDYGDRIPDKDFILRIDVRETTPQPVVLTHREDGGDGYLTLAVQPPKLPADGSGVLGKDLFFVVDNSGSMHGPPMAASKALVREALRNLNPDDRFTIMRFSDDVSSLSAVPLENTPDNVERGLAFIDAMRGMGGTRMLSGIRRALEGEPEAGRVRIVFFLTDGYIGNDDEIVAEVQHRNHAGARLFSLGVGSSVNRALLADMARMGRGEFRAMRVDEPIAPVVERFYARVRNPVLTDIELDWGELPVYDGPETVPDLFDGQPLLVHARYREAASGVVTVKGQVAGAPYAVEVPVTLPARRSDRAVASLWARARIADWMHAESDNPGEWRDEIVALAMAHRLMSKYTAFVAVDHAVVREAHAPLIPVAQRLPLPEDVSSRALGALSRRDIPPGDPIISIAAPADAKRVTAYFPFGLIEDLHYDAVRDVWRARFLVPAGIPDGDYVIVVRIEHADGRVQIRKEAYTLDSSAAEFTFEVDEPYVQAGGRVTFEVDTIEPAHEVYAHAEALGWMRVALAPDAEGVRWRGTLKVPDGVKLGEHTVMLVVRDLAGNRLEAFTGVFVDGPALGDH